MTQAQTQSQGADPADPGAQQTYTLNEAARKFKIDSNFCRILILQYQVPVVPIGGKSRRVVPASSLPQLRDAIRRHREIRFNDVPLAI